MIENIISKRKMKWRNINVDIDKNSRIKPIIRWISKECDLVRMVEYTYYFFAFTIERTQNRLNTCPRWFLDEDDVKFWIDFEDSVNNKIILTNILRENFDILTNYIEEPLTAEWIDLVLFS